MDLVGGISKYEEGEMDMVEVVELFQHLVNTGLAWSLQGHYGRTAEALIEEGLVHNGPAYPDHEMAFMLEGEEE